MFRTHRVVVLTAGLLVIAAMTAPPAFAQTTTTYHLHKEASLINSSNKQLKTAGPDATQTALQTANLKGSVGNFTSPIANFETQTGVPGLAGVIPANAVVTFSVYMKVTSLPSSGSIYPYVVLTLNSASGHLLCTRGQQDGAPALTTTLTQLTLTCGIGASPITVATSDRFFLQVGVAIAGTVGNHNTFGEVDIETNADSTVTAPNPAPNITSLSVTSGIVGAAVTITGTGFGSAGTVTFNGTAASTSSWNSTTIQTSVPAGVAPGAGPVVVISNGQSGPGVTFTVMPHITTLTPAADAIGQAVSIGGTGFGSVAGAITFNGAPASATQWTPTSINVAVPVGATTGPVVVTAGGQASNGSTFTLITAGTVTGTITHATGGAALSGATVQAVLTGIVQGTATSAADGTYTIGGLNPGTYDIRVLATGYSSEVRSGTSISANMTATVNVAMSQPGTIAGTVTQSDGVTAIAGAVVTVFSGPIQTGTANTDSLGHYSIGNLHPGAFTVQAVNVGNHTAEQGAVVTENTTTTANLSLDVEPAGSVLYAYDPLGRLVQVTDPSGDAAIYHYDAVGNITEIDRSGSTTVSISGFTPASGGVGNSVTIFGTGFSATPGANTVLFNGTSATVSSSTTTQIAVTVPAAATSGPISVTAPPGSATSPSAFTVSTTSGAPTIGSFTPTLVAPGDALTVTGTNFDTTLANDRLNVNVASAQVSSGSGTSLATSVPVTTTGHVSITTENGSATSTDYLWVAPPPYTTAQIDSTGTMTFGTPLTIPVNTGGNVAIRAFEGVQGHRASVNLTGGTFAGGGSMGLYGVYGTQYLIGFTGTGFLEPINLTATGTYTLLVAPNSPYTGSATLTVYDVPADQTSPIVAGGSAVPVSLTAPGQNARLSFQASAGDRVCATFTTTSIAGGNLQFLRPDTTPINTVLFTTGTPAFLDTISIPSAGAYTVFIDPSTTNTGTGSATLYSVPADMTGPITINDPTAVPVSLATCQNGTLSFSGTGGQQVTVHVTGNTMGAVTVKLLSSDGTTVLAQALSSAANFDLVSSTLPTNGTATYTITIDPFTTNSGTLNVTITSSSPPPNASHAQALPYHSMGN